MKAPIATLPKRGYDKWGSGAFLAARGDRQHEGVDYACYPGTVIYPAKSGEVTKINHLYSDDPSFLYIEVRDYHGYRCRYGYVEPVVKPGDTVTPSTLLGEAQDISKRYEDITKHIHVEVRTPQGELMDPEEYFNG